MEKLIIEKLWSFFRPIFENKWFDRIAGLISLLNPISLFPQLWNCIVLDKLVGVSASMYFFFAVIQVAFAFVAIKAKNLWVFISMVLSVIVSLSIAILTLMKDVKT